MELFYKGSVPKILLDWEITRGKTSIREDFGDGNGKAEVWAFLTGDNGLIPLSLEIKNNVLECDIPQGLGVGVYGAKVIWVKDGTGSKSLDELLACNKRCVTEVFDLFGISESRYADTNTSSDITIHIKSSVATYGYDGLSAYEKAVMLGITDKSEEEWLYTPSEFRDLDSRLQQTQREVNALYTSGIITQDTSNLEDVVKFSIIKKVPAGNNLSQYIELSAGTYYVSVLSDTDFGYAYIYGFNGTDHTNNTDALNVKYLSGVELLEVTVEGIDGIGVHRRNSWKGLDALPETEYEILVCKKGSLNYRMMEMEQKLLSNIQDVVIPMQELLKNEYSITNGGKFSTSQKHKASDYIPYIGNKAIKYSGLNQATNAYCLAFYDKDKKFLGGILGTDDFLQSGTAQPPAGTRYIAVCTRARTLDYARLFLVNTVVDLTKKIVELEDAGEADSEAISPLEGKTIVCFGDSITELTGDGGKSYPEYLSSITGATVYNLGIGGSHLHQRVVSDDLIVTSDDTFTDENEEGLETRAAAAFDIVNMVRAACEEKFGETETTYLQIAKMANNYLASLEGSHKRDRTNQLKALEEEINWNKVDIVVIMGGTNDWSWDNSANSNPNYKERFGTSDSTSVDKTLGAVNVIIETLLSKYKHLKLYWATPPIRWMPDQEQPPYTFTTARNFSDEKEINGRTLKQFAASVMATVENHHIPVIDLYNTLGWNKYNFSNYFSRETDGTHPYNGFLQIAQKIASVLISENQIVQFDVPSNGAAVQEYVFDDEDYEGSESNVTITPTGRKGRDSQMFTAVANDDYYYYDDGIGSWDELDMPEPLDEPLD